MYIGNVFKESGMWYIYFCCKFFGCVCVFVLDKKIYIEDFFKVYLFYGFCSFLGWIIRGYFLKVLIKYFLFLLVSFNVYFLDGKLVMEMII